jgi:hypothetical protein
MINFKCSSCSRSLTADDDLANEIMDCPHCQTAIEVPAFKSFQKQNQTHNATLEQTNLLKFLLAESIKQTEQLVLIRLMVSWFYYSA